MQDKDLPKISIVTPSYNHGDLLERTLLSIQNQPYPKKEHIVIDGGSIDQTVEILKQFDQQLFYWVSEPDQGQSDALQKGFKIATGDIFCWLNTGDSLEPDTLTFIAHFFAEHPNIDWIIGNDVVEVDNWSYPNVPQEEVALDRLLAGQIIYQDAVFFRRSLYESVEGINSDLWGAMDYDLWLQFLLTNSNFRVIPNLTLSRFLIHSNQKSSNKNRYEMEMQKSRSLRTTIQPNWVTIFSVNRERFVASFIAKVYKLPIPFFKLLLHLSSRNSWYFHSDRLPKFDRVNEGKDYLLCPCCNASTFSHRLSLHENRFHQPGIYEIVWCPNCDVGLTRPQLDTYRLTALYEQFYSDRNKVPEETSVTQNLVKQTFLRRVIRNFISSQLVIPPQYSGKLLDFGCNDGTNLEMYKQLGRFEVFGLDINPTAVSIAQKKGFAVHCGTVTDSPWEDNFFDVIVLSQVIEHLPDPVTTLLQLRQKLKIDGHIILTLPNAKSFWAKLFHMAWAHWHVPYHLYHYSPSAITLLAKRSELAIQSITTKSPSYWLFLSLYLHRNYASGKYLDLSIYPKPGILDKALAVSLQLFSSLFIDPFMKGDMITVILKQTNNEVDKKAPIVN